MSQLDSYRSALLNLAEVQGVSALNPITYKVVTGSDKLVFVSYSQPSPLLVLPLNVIWLDANPISTTYGQLFRRVYSYNVDHYDFGFDLITDYSDLLYTVQIYDQAQMPEPVVVSLSGGQLTQALKPRVSASYAQTEVVPLSVVDQKVTAFRQSIMSLYQGLNSRELYDDKRIRDLVIGLTNLQSTITGGNTYTHNQQIARASWVVNHGLKTMAPEVSIWVEDELVMADEVTCVDQNSVVIYFSYAVSGLATVRK